MSKAKKFDTVFMEYLPQHQSNDSGWALAPSVNSRAALQRIVKYLVISIMFLGLTLAVFYALFAWLVNQ